MKQPSFFNKAVSEKLGINPNIVRKVNSFFWTEVKRDLSNVTHRSIFLKNFGTITVSKYKLNKQIREIIWKIRRVQRSLFYTPLKKSLILESQIKNLRNLLFQRNEIAKFYYNLKNDVVVK